MFAQKTKLKESKLTSSGQEQSGPKRDKIVYLHAPFPQKTFLKTKKIFTQRTTRTRCFSSAKLVLTAFLITFVFASKRRLNIEFFRQKNLKTNNNQHRVAKNQEKADNIPSYNYEALNQPMLDIFERLKIHICIKRKTVVLPKWPDFQIFVTRFEANVKNLGRKLATFTVLVSSIHLWHHRKMRSIYV